VADLPYNGQATLWMSPSGWQAVQAANRPDVATTAGVVQALVVVAAPGTAPEDLAGRIDAATGGATTTLTTAAAADAQPGVQEQRSTFNQIIGVTTAIAVVVIALFFALLVVERTAMYGVLKAIGARSSTIFAGVVAQALVVTAIAGMVAAVTATVLALVIPAGSIPYVMTATRIATTIVLLLVAAVIGCAFSLRRVLRIDPASAIGTAS
jgi:putative ABC transport system permease protein